MKITDIRKMNHEELRKELENSHQELFNLRFRLSTRQLENYRELSTVKKNIARIKTVMREMELSGS